VESDDEEKPVKRGRRAKYVFDKVKDVETIMDMSDVDEDEKEEYIRLVREDVFPDHVLEGVSENAVRIQKCRYRQRLYNLLKN
jgi:hypothetical protein